MPTVSIIMPVYNTERYLDAAIGSVLAQTYPDFELLLVDDGSTDNSFKKCCIWAEKDLRIRLLQQENQGHGAARNAGIKASLGSWIQFVDSDDIILPNMLEALISGIKNSRYDFARCRFARFYDDDPSKKKPDIEPVLDMANKEQVQQEFLLPLLGSLYKERAICGTVCTTIYRREIIENNRLSFLHAHQLQSEDLLFNLAFLCHASGGALIPEPLYLYRTRKDSFTNQYSPQVFSRLVSLNQVLQEFVAAQLDDSTALTRVGARLLDGVSVCAKDLALQKKGEDYLSEIRHMTETPCVREALAGRPGKTRTFPLSLFCFLLRHRLFRLFRIFVQLYPHYQSLFYLHGAN